MEIVAKNPVETAHVASLLAQAAKESDSGKGAVVLALVGELGAGKTAFTAAFARAFGVREPVLSPTFVLMKIYPLKLFKRFKHFVHIDCYRLKNPRGFLHLGLREIFRDRDAVVVIEWADRIKKLLPRDAVWIKFRHGKKPQERLIQI